eukprot:4800285-Amphidinium_carterae.1
MGMCLGFAICGSTLQRPAQVQLPILGVGLWGEFTVQKHGSKRRSRATRKEQHNNNDEEKLNQATISAQKDLATNSNIADSNHMTTSRMKSATVLIGYVVVDSESVD